VPRPFAIEQEDAMRVALQVLAWVAGSGAVLAALFVLSFRTGFAPVLRLIKSMNRRFTNPRQLRTAGDPGAYASVVHHVGRQSGTPYRTPVVAVPTDDGFAMALPYGSTADWVRNVLVAGTATIDHEGETVPVDSPAIVGPAEVEGTFGDQGMNRIFGLDEFLVVHRTTRKDDESDDEADT
jgi:deazaflavin-dependent oxidoreductase (nitroreductase family)